jgi:anhydro-N-acetylmuramic acid kinase
MELYIGVMSGTSLDGIDIVITDISDDKVQLIASKTYPFRDNTKLSLQKIIHDPVCSLKDLGSCDVALGEDIASGINQLLKESKINSRDIIAIGNHGQTLYHQPNEPHKFSMQIGNPSLIVERTNITTVADFRQRDMALAGQGAPLVPAFHKVLFQDESINRVILNIGGISNITVLPSEQSPSKIFGFDTGPGNTLLDMWCQTHTQQSFDKNGQWAKQGNVNNQLLEQLLKDSYFSQPIPKSTGREYFNLSWLNRQIANLNQSLTPVDIQATLAQLTVESIVNDINKFAIDVEEVYVCGGGAYNTDLIQRLKLALNPVKVISTNALGVAPEWVEAIAFAWLAKQAIHKNLVMLSDVTGAHRDTLLGGIYYSSNDDS